MMAAPLFMALPGFLWVGGEPNMVGQGGTDHARHRTLSIPARPAVAMDREPRESRYERAARGCLGRAFGCSGVELSALFPSAAGV